MPKVGFIQGLFQGGTHGRLIAKAPNGNKIYQYIHNGEKHITGINSAGKVINSYTKSGYRTSNGIVTHSQQVLKDKPSYHFTKIVSKDGRDIKIINEIQNLETKRKAETTLLLRKENNKYNILKIHSWINDRFSVQAKLSAPGHIITQNSVSRAVLPEYMENSIKNWRAVLKLINHLIYK